MTGQVQFEPPSRCGAGIVRSRLNLGEAEPCIKLQRDAASPTIISLLKLQKTLMDFLTNAFRRATGAMSDAMSDAEQLGITSADEEAGERNVGEITTIQLQKTQKSP